MARERHALQVSIAASVALGIIGVAWGIVSGSQVILLDGLFSVIGIATSWMLLRASALAVGGPSRSYPFGREAITPLVIGVQGVIMGATLVYAAAEALLTILRGGSDVAPIPAIAYGVLVTIACAAAWVWLRRSAGGSEIITAETAGWRVALLRGIGMILGFGVLLLITGTSLDGLAPFIDPAMVLVTCVALIGTPVSLVRSTVLELLESVPPERILRPVADAVEGVTTQHGVDDADLRVTKLGRKVYVEVNALADPSTTIVQEEAVRADLRDRLETMPYGVWLNLELHPRSGNEGEAS